VLVSPLDQDTLWTYNESLLNFARNWSCLTARFFRLSGYLRRDAGQRLGRRVCGRRVEPKNWERYGPIGRLLSLME
jgi:hypothetical protein